MTTGMPIDMRAHLKVERRSYIIGSLVVLFVVQAAVTLLQVMMEPTLLAAPFPTHVAAVMARMAQAQAALGWQQQLALDLVGLAGAVGLFFLNWRFSFLLQRPRAAFQPSQRLFGPRLLWWLALFLTSMFYGVLLPQIAVTWLLARWGRQELDRMARAAPPPPPTDEVNA